MFPTDSEFTVVYLVYILVLFYLVYKYIKGKRKIYFRANLIFYVGYTLFASIFLYGNPENFKGGGSLGVLVFSSAFVVIHIAILLMVGFVRLFRKGLFW